MKNLLELLKIAVEQVQDWLIITDTNGIILYNNSQVEKLSGYKKEEIIGHRPSIWKSNIFPRSTYEKLWSTILGGEAYYGVIANRHKDGNIFYIANTISPVKNEDGKITYFVSTAKDITQNYKLEKQLYEFIHYDVLTQLPNRKLFIDQIQEAINNKSKNKVAVLAINLKKINIINNTYGFVSGDKVIKEVGKRITNAIDNEYILARVESDMFAILVPGLKKLSKIVPLIKNIGKAIERPIILEDKELYMEIATGVATYPNDALEANDLLTRAQTALLGVQMGNNLHNYAFYTTQMNEEVERQLELESEIYKAYENDEFIPYFQPLIRLKDKKIYALEALMRRKNSTGEIIPPSQFIDILEQIGLIEKVELQFIRKICVQIHTWLEKGIKVVPVAINISPLQFRNKNLPREIMGIIKEERIPYNMVKIEITESLFVEDMELAKSIVNELKSQGILIAIDDFGTGYSSLSYLKEFSADHLKIDMSFIREIVTNQGDKAIVEAIISIAKALNMETIAEGIETKDQLRLLTKLGCNIGQGLYWDGPLPGEEIENKYLYKANKSII